MVANHEKDLLLMCGIDSEAVQDDSSHLRSTFGMPLDPNRLSNVVQKENKVQERWCRILAQAFTILIVDGFVRQKYVIEYSHGAERVYVRRVTMIILMLHQAGKPLEFRNESPKHPEVMHG